MIRSVTKCTMTQNHLVSLGDPFDLRKRERCCVVRESVVTATRIPFFPKVESMPTFEIFFNVTLDESPFHQFIPHISEAPLVC